MSRIHDIRNAIDAKLDKWEMSAVAMEAQFNISKDEAIARFEELKEKLNDALTRFKAEVDKSTAATDEMKAKLRTQFDHLQVQLALGKAETKEAYEAQKKKIRDAITAFESNIDQELDEALDTAAKDLVNAIDALDAELDALEVQYELEKAKAQAQYEEVKKDVSGKIRKLQDDLKEKTRLAPEKAAEFEKDMSAGLSQIKQAFSKLFH